MKPKIEIIRGDITTLQVDAIVNAANSSLLGGGGVDGAIHAAAGVELLAECSSLNGCATGQAKITKGYLLPARYIIHTVGPKWQDGLKNESNLLAACYRNCLQLAVEHNLSTLAFPSISTGIYGYPIEEASRIAVREIAVFLQNHDEIQLVNIVCFGERPFRIYNLALHAYEANPDPDH